MPVLRAGSRIADDQPVERVGELQHPRTHRVPLTLVGRQQLGRCPPVHGSGNLPTQLCLIDDAQWLDGPSADALTFTARRLDVETIMLLFAARDGERRTFSASGLPELRLTGLDAAAAQALLSEGVPVVPEVRDLLVASTAGNPLALRELPASLTGDQLAGRVPLPDRLPVGASVERVFLARVRRQPPATQTLLLLAAAEETGDLAAILAAAQRLGVPADALDAAERAGLVNVDATG